MMSWFKKLLISTIDFSTKITKETFHPPEEGESRLYLQPHLPHDVLIGSQEGVLLNAHDF